MPTLVRPPAKQGAHAARPRCSFSALQLYTLSSPFRDGATSQLTKVSLEQRSINSSPSRCLALSQGIVQRPQTSPRRAAPENISDHRVRQPSITLRPEFRLSRLPWLLQPLLGRAVHHGYHVHAAQPQGDRMAFPRTDLDPLYNQMVALGPR